MFRFVLALAICLSSLPLHAGFVVVRENPFGPGHLLDEWSAKHASTSAISALNKNTFLNFDAANTGLGILDWLPYRHIKSDIQSPRHAAILKTIIEKVNSRALDEVVIVFTGGQHAIELSLAHPDLHALYAFAPFSEETQIVNSLSEYAKGLEQFSNRSNGSHVKMILRYLKRMHPEMSSDVIAHSIKKLARMNLAYFANNKPQGVLDRSQILTRPQVFIFADTHGVVSNPQISDFPVKALVDSGVQKVTFLVEPFGVDEAIDIKDLEKHATLGGQFSTDSDEFRAAISQVSLDLTRQLEQSQTVIFPSTKQLGELASRMRKSGLKVDIKGLEEKPFYKCATTLEKLL